MCHFRYEKVYIILYVHVTMFLIGLMNKANTFIVSLTNTIVRVTVC